MKTAKVLLLGLLLASLVLSACGSPAPAAPQATNALATGATEAPATGEKVELVYWSMWNEPEPQALAIAKWIDAFEAEHPNVTIKAVWNGRENQTKVKTALGSGTKIDLVDQDSDQLAGGLMAEGQGYPLDELLEQKAPDEDSLLKDIFSPGILDMHKKDGHYYLWTYVYNPVIFWYNKDIFDEAGIQEPPKDWDEFLADMQKIKDTGVVPLVLDKDAGVNNMFYFVYLVERMKGPGFLLKTIEDKTGEMWKDPVYLKAMKMLEELWTKEYIPPESKGYVWPQGQNTQGTGEAAINLCGAWLPTELSSLTGPDFRWGGFRFPAVSGGAGSIDDLHAWNLSFMILKDSEHPQEAMEFLKFIMAKDNLKLMVDEAMVGVTRKGMPWPDAIQDGAAAAASANVTFMDADGGSALHPEFTKNVLFNTYIKAFLGEMTPEEFINQMVTQSQEYWKTHDN